MYTNLKKNETILNLAFIIKAIRVWSMDHKNFKWYSPTKSLRTIGI